MKAALAACGPLSVCVNANTWDDYTQIVYKTKCSGAYNKLDHCVQFVGYDTIASTSYWKIRNCHPEIKSEFEYSLDGGLSLAIEFRTQFIWRLLPFVSGPCAQFFWHQVPFALRPGLSAMYLDFMRFLNFVLIFCKLW